MSSEKLETILAYVQADKSRHSDKVYAIGGMMQSIEKMEIVKNMIDSAMSQYKKSFAESLWEKCMFDDQFDVAELRALIRGAQDNAKDTTAA